MNNQAPHRGQTAPGTAITIPATPRQAPSAPAPTKGTNQAVSRDIGLSALDLDGWLEFNRLKWNVRPRRLAFPNSDAEPPSIEAVVYLDKGGQIVNPPRNPYLPVRFLSTPTDYRHRLMRQWLEVATMLATATRRQGLRNTLNLPPEVTDVRPWQWAGFRAGVRYTMIIDLPFDPALVHRQIERSRRKAEREGFRCERVTNMGDVVTCLADMGERQDFDVGLTRADLELVTALLGEEHCRSYVCYAPNGEPASSSVVLHRPGAAAIGWLGGTSTRYLPAGVVQQLERFVIADLEHLGVTHYDLSGANLPFIAAAKAQWGVRLEPYYTIEGYSVRKLARWALNWWDYLKQGRAR